MNQPDATFVIDDALLELVSKEEQQMAARHAQDAFTRILRATLGADEGGEQPAVAKTRQQAVADANTALLQWAYGGKAQGEAADLRMALLLMALDQWGIAYSDAFGQAATVGISELIGLLRNALSPEEEARCQRFFGQVNEAEMNAFDFKIEMRREIHLALWHAMISSEGEEGREQAFAILRQLGGMMVALTKVMPDTGWRLVSDSLAHIQIRCLAHALAIDGVAQETTQELFIGFSREFDQEARDRIMGHAAQVVMAWQQARRNMH